MTTLTSKPRPKKLLEELRGQLRTRHYVSRTEKTNFSWVRKYIIFHNKRHPKNMGASTQNQALSAILFLYRYVLNVELAQNTH